MNTITFCRIFSLILGIIMATLVEEGKSFQGKTKAIQLNQPKPKDRFSHIGIEKHFTSNSTTLSAV